MDLDFGCKTEDVGIIGLQIPTVNQLARGSQIMEMEKRNGIRRKPEPNVYPMVWKRRTFVTSQVNIVSSLTTLVSFFLWVCVSGGGVGWVGGWCVILLHSLYSWDLGGLLVLLFFWRRQFPFPFFLPLSGCLCNSVCQSLLVGPS